MAAGGFGGAWPAGAAGGFAAAAGLAAAGFSSAGLAGSGGPAAGSAPSGFGSSAIRYPYKITTINTGGWESQIECGLYIFRNWARMRYPKFHAQGLCRVAQA